MTDTPPEIDRMVRQRLMARSAEDRFIMGAEMFESAVAMITASFPPGLSATERRRRLFERIYGTAEARVFESRRRDDHTGSPGTPTAESC